MTFKDRLRALRTERGWSYEFIGEMLGISPKTVEDWETGQTDPSMNDLLALKGIFGVSIDYLLGNEKPDAQSDDSLYQPRHREYKSKLCIGGLPLVHINIGNGKLHKAKGIIAIGNAAVGVVAIGAFAVGVITFAGIGAGLVGLGAMMFGLLFACGGLAAGGIAIGGMAVGYLAVGGIAVGIYSVGGVAAAVRIALGGAARAHIAVGDDSGGKFAVQATQNFELIGMTKPQLEALIKSEYPKISGPIFRLIMFFVR